MDRARLRAREAIPSRRRTGRCAGRGLRHASAALLLLGLLLLPSPAAAQVVARVNGVALDRRALDRQLDRHLGAQGRSSGSIRTPEVWRRLRAEALEQLVDEELLWQEAVRRGRTAPDAAVEEAFEAARRRSGASTPDRYALRLETQGFTPEGFRAHLRRQLSIEALLREDVLRAPADPERAVPALLAELRAKAAIEKAKEP